MGSSKSKDVADAVANVSNYVGSSTAANTTQVNQLSQDVTFEDCTVIAKGNLTVNEYAQLMQTNNQFIKANQDANLSNNIQQQMLQTATSKVGFLGIGYADASNSATEMVNSTNQIVQDMQVSANQFSGTSQDFVCDRSFIEANNIVIDLGSAADFMSTQTLDQTQTADIVNDISQTVTQKATATVEGISSLLFGVLLIIAVIVWALMKPLSTGAAKTAVGIAVCFLLAGVVVFMYLRQTPPFFEQPSKCINNSNIGCDTECVDMQPNQRINLTNPPMRYIYGITPNNLTVPGGGANLVQMAIASLAPTSGGPGDNGGYRMDNMNTLQSMIQAYAQYANSLGVTNIPNPLTGYYNGQNYEIPVQYVMNGGSGNGDPSGICTPAILQLSQGSQGTILNCSNNIDPVLQGLPTSQNPAQSIANLNSAGWDLYLNGGNPIGTNDTPQNRALFARFVLCDIIGRIDLNVFVQPNELVRVTDSNGNLTVGLPQDYPSQCYRFNPYSPNRSWADGISGGGYLIGEVGVCNSPDYKFQNFMKNIGGYILLSILVLAFGYMGYSSYKNKNAPDNSGSSAIGSAIQETIANINKKSA
jgi:hypothetical protein